MIHSQTGKIAEDFYLLGHPVIPVYLLDGPLPVIFDAGLAMLGNFYLSEIERVLGERTPAYCLLTHAHFDHCGAVAAFKRRYPRMQVMAAGKASDILQRSSAVDRIVDLNAAAEPLLRQIGIPYDNDQRFEPFAVDRIAQGGDRVKVSAGCAVDVIESPGHTWDCLSYRIAGKNILLSSEAAGQPDRSGVIITDCLADYDRYLESLLKLKIVEPDYLCLGHLFVYSGADTAAYLADAHRACLDFRQTVDSLAAESGGQLAPILQGIKTIEYDKNPGPKQPEPAYLINLEARIKAVLKAGQQLPAE